MMKGALEGVKVLDFGWVQTAPRTVRFLADYGAEVIKIESSKGTWGAAGRLSDYNRNRWGMTLNLKHPRASEVTRRMVAWADIVAENFTPGTMDDLGVGYKDLIKIKPDIILVSMSNQGATGPRSSVPGYGSNLAALAGVYNLIGWPDRPPSEPQSFYFDNLGPRVGITVIMAALDYRRRTGKGQFIDFAQFETGLHFFTPIYQDYAVNGRQSMRMGNRSPYGAPHGVYRCRGEDRWCAIAVFTDEEWQAFGKVLGSPAWVKAPKFSTLLARKSHEDELDRLVEAWTTTYPPEEVMAKMQSAGVDAAVVQNNEEVINDPQLKHRNEFVVLEHPTAGKQLYTNLGFKLSKTPVELRMASPTAGQHNEYICKDILGFSDEEFKGLVTDGVLV